MSVIVGETVTPEYSGEWRSIQDAARHLSVSERTIYRRADRGQLRCRTLGDGRVEVFVPMTPTADVSDGTSDNDSHERSALLVDRVSVAVSRQLETVTMELGASRERIEILARENGTLTERLTHVTAELDTARADLERAASGMVALGDELEAIKRFHSPVAPDLTPQPAVSASDTRMAISRRLAWVLALTAGAVLLFGLLLAWPR